MKHHHPDVFCAALMNAQPMASTRPHRSSATRASTGSRCGHLASMRAGGIAPSSEQAGAIWRCGLACG